MLTGGEKLEKTRKTLLEVLLADHPVPCEKGKKGECPCPRKPKRSALMPASPR